MPLATLVLDALFPDACLACLSPRDPGWRHPVACAACLGSVPLPERFSCTACGAAGPGIVPPCHPAAATASALGPPESRVVGELVAALLYEGISRAAAPLGELLAGSCVSLGLPLHKTAFAPVPETAYAVRERGFSADGLVAAAVAECLSARHEPHLLSASRAGPATLYGIGSTGGAGDALLVVLVASALPPPSATTRITELVAAACPRARTTFLACTA